MEFRLRERLEVRPPGDPRPPGSRRTVIIVSAALLVVAIAVGAFLLGRPPGESQAPPREPQAAPFEPQAPEGRLGLHVTEQELGVWRERALQGPYRVDGDVSPNSPGDWARITEYTESFLADPSAGRWEGPVENNPGGCVLRDGGQAGDLGYQPPVRESTELLASAFYAMVAQTREPAEAVKAELLAQAREPGVDFADRNRWCVGEILDGSPGFMVANWLTKFMFAADYLEVYDPVMFSPEERAELDRWFWSAADWMRQDTDLKIDEMFVDRPNGDYRLANPDDLMSRDDKVVYFGGPVATKLQTRFNNRVARQVRFVTLVGIDQNHAHFVEHGKRFVKDSLRFTYFPAGAVGDFERWTAEEPIKGWKYGAEFTGALVTIADHLARVGDTELYDYTTTEGALGTEGSHGSGTPKSLRTLVADIMRYVDHSYERYGTDNPRRAGDPEYLIDSIDDRDGSERINEIQTSIANLYYRDPYIASVYTRQAPGAPPYPEVVEQGAGDPEGGEGGTFPGVLFMFGGLEDQVWPYPEGVRR